MDERKYVCDFYSVWAQGTALYVKWSAKHGISYTELSVLYALLAKGSTTQKTICEFYGLPKQTVNTCIKDLKAKNYVLLTANEEDKREKIVTLSEAGLHFSQNLLAPLFQIEEYICQNINPEKFIQAIETKELFNLLFEKEMERSSKIYE